MKRLKVLLPIDESDLSHKALPIVGSTLNPSSTDVTLLRVTVKPQLHETRLAPSSLSGGLDSRAIKPDPSYRIHLDELRANVVANLKIKLKEEVTLLESQGFAVSTEVRFGDAAEEIIHEAQNKYDMIVMATHGRTGLGRVLLGSVSEKVMRNAQIPVMLFKPDKKKVST